MFFNITSRIFTEDILITASIEGIKVELNVVNTIYVKECFGVSLVKKRKV